MLLPSNSVDMLSRAGVYAVKNVDTDALYDESDEDDDDLRMDIGGSNALLCGPTYG